MRINERKREKRRLEKIEIKGKAKRNIEKTKRREVEKKR